MLYFILVICLISFLITSPIVTSQQPPEDESTEGPQQISLTREMVDNLLTILSPGIKDLFIFVTF